MSIDRALLAVIQNALKDAPEIAESLTVDSTNEDIQGALREAGITWRQVFASPGSDSP